VTTRAPAVFRMVHAARDLGRIGDISKVLVRHGFGEVVARLGFRRTKGSDPPPGGSASAELASVASPDEVLRGDQERREISVAVRLRLVLEDLGPTFVKLGQIASTRPDVLPLDVIAELRKLQDAVPPVGFDAIRQQVERSLGAPLGDLFESVDESPLAAGSIAQVHRARLRADPASLDVVVKVQRPGIVQTIASDLDLLHTFAALVERAIPESRIYSPVGLVQQFDRAISSELDFSLEAENAVRFSQNFQGHAHLKFPRVYREASSKQVLTLEYLDGKKLYEAVAAGHSGKKLAHVALEAVLKQIFEDGFFHADPHPGNAIILGTPDHPVVALVDLGMVGRLSPRLRDLAVDVMFSALRRDYTGLADAIYAIGSSTRKIDRDAFEAEVAMRTEKYLGRPLKDIELSGMIRDLVQGATQFGLEIPTDFTLVAKALMTLEGVGRELDPELDVLSEARPMLFELMRKRYSPERIGNELLRRLERLSGATYNLPRQLEEVLEDLRLGRLSLRTSDAEAHAAADRTGRRIFAGVFSSSLVLSGSWLFSTGHDWLGATLLLLCALLLFGQGAAEIRQSWRGWRRRQ
jgi:ubiquinone biosynthesis protein